MKNAAENLAKIIQCQTVSVSNGDDYSAFAQIHTLLQKLYPNVFSVMNFTKINDYSIILRWSSSQKSAKPVLYCAHLDVVPAGEGWTKSPFGGEICNGKIYGRGALDMKNTLACLLESAESLITTGFTPRQDIYFAFGHDEELGGFNGAANVAKYFAENNIKFEMILDELGFISTENDRKIARIGVSEKGISNFTLTARDDGGHASTPAQSTALGRLSEAIVRIEKNQPPIKLTPLAKDYFSAICPEINLENADELQKLSQNAMHNALLRTTAATTIMKGGHRHNVLPKIATANVNVRLLQGTTSDEYYEFLQDLISDLDIEITARKMKEAIKVSDYKSEIYKKFSGIVKDFFADAIPVPHLMTGSTDSSFYENLSENIYRFCPFELEKGQYETIHAADEYVRVDSLQTAIEFYKSVMKTEW